MATEYTMETYQKLGLTTCDSMFGCTLHSYTLVARLQTLVGILGVSTTLKVVDEPKEDIFPSFLDIIAQLFTQEQRQAMVGAAESWISNVKVKDPKDSQIPPKLWAMDNDMIAFRGFEEFKGMICGPRIWWHTESKFGQCFNIYLSPVPQPDALIGLLIKYPAYWDLGHPNNNRSPG